MGSALARLEALERERNRVMMAESCADVAARCGIDPEELAREGERFEALVDAIGWDATEETIAREAGVSVEELRREAAAMMAKYP